MQEGETNHKTTTKNPVCRRHNKDHSLSIKIVTRHRYNIIQSRANIKNPTCYKWLAKHRYNIILSLSYLIYPLTARVIWAPQMIWQPVSSIFPCSLLPSWTWQTPGLAIPWCCLPTSSSVCLVFFPLSLCLARWFWPDLMNGRHDHTTAVCVSLQWSGGLHMVWLPVGSWHRLPRW